MIRDKVDNFVKGNPAQDKLEGVAAGVLSAFQNGPVASLHILNAVQNKTKRAAEQAREAHVNFETDIERAQFVTAWIFWAIRHDSQSCKDAIGKMLEWVGELAGTDVATLETIVDQAIAEAE